MDPQSLALHVRRASGPEAPLVHSVMQAAYAQYIGRLDPPSGAHAESVADVAAAMALGGAALAFLDDSASGSVRYRPDADHLYMERLAVLPDCRHRGVATALARFVQAEAERQGLPSVRLGVRLVLTDNWRLYLGLGYGFRELHLRAAAGGVTVTATMERPLQKMLSGDAPLLCGELPVEDLFKIADRAKRAA
ncbi:GCN5-related N-acetyltransferase domain protein, partial [mine drainage metagenome]